MGSHLLIRTAPSPCLHFTERLRFTAWRVVTPGVLHSVWVVPLDTPMLLFCTPKTEAAACFVAHVLPMHCISCRQSLPRVPPDGSGGTQGRAGDSTGTRLGALHGTHRYEPPEDESSNQKMHDTSCVPVLHCNALGTGQPLHLAIHRLLTGDPSQVSTTSR